MVDLQTIYLDNEGVNEASRLSRAVAYWVRLRLPDREVRIGDAMTLPQPFWAVILAVLGVVLAIACLFHPTEEKIVLAILAIASNLVSGALGAFVGHAGAINATQSPTVQLPGNEPKQ